MQPLPAEHPPHRAIPQHHERAPDVGQDRARRAQPAIGLLGRADPVVDFLDRREAAQRIVEIGGGQAGDRAGPGDHRHSGRVRRRIQPPHIADEVARIGKVAVMRPRPDRRLRHAVILPLERPDGVDHQIGLEWCQRGGAYHIDIERRGLGWIGCRKLSGKGLRLGQASSGNHQRDRGIARQRPRDIAAKIAVAAQNQHPRGHVGFATISQNTPTSPAKAGQPSANQVRKWRSNCA